MSQKYQLDATDLKIILKHLIVVVIGAVLTYLVQLIPNINFGAYQPIAVIVGALLTTLLNQFFRGN